MLNISRKEGGNVIPGRAIPVFIRNGPYHLEELKIYQDGQIDCWGFVDLNGFRKKIEEGWVATDMEVGATLEIGSLGKVTVQEFHARVKAGELVKEVADIIEELNGRPTSLGKCQASYAHYDKDPTKKNRDLLKKMYEDVPEHNRRFLCGQDVQDIPIRMVIYGEEEIEKWSHRIIARKIGQTPLPTIEVKKPKDE